MRPERGVQARRFEAMGTECAIFAVGVPAERLIEGERWVHRTAARFTRFSAASELCRLNASSGRWFEVTADLEAVLRAALVAFEMSNGLVNVAVLGSMAAIGYAGPMAEGVRAP